MRHTRIYGALLVVFLGSAATSPQGCNCARSISEHITYDGPTFDIAHPYPAVVDISAAKTWKLIRIEVTLPTGEARGSTTRILLSGDNGQTWVAAQEFRDPGLRSPSNPSIVYSDAGRDYFRRSFDGGLHWQEPAFMIDGQRRDAFIQRIAGGRPARFFCRLAAVHPRSPKTVYGAFTVWVYSTKERDYVERTYAVAGLFVSEDAGDSWRLLAPDLRNESPLGISGTNPDIMIAYSKGGVVRSLNGGKTWFAVGQQAELLKQAEIKGRQEALEKLSQKGFELSPRARHPDYLNLGIYQIAFQPNHSNVVFLVSNKGLFRSEDGGSTWCLLNLGKDKLGWVSSLYFDPLNSRHIYVGTEEEIMFSTDCGCNFRRIFDLHKLIKVFPDITKPRK